MGRTSLWKHIRQAVLRNLPILRRKKSSKRKVQKSTNGSLLAKGTHPFYTIGVGLIVGFGVLHLLFYCLIQGVDTPTSHFDGAFQTASSMHRLSLGQLPGRDFFPYLGVGLVYLLYPFYLLGGSHLMASIMAMHAVVILVHISMVTVVHFLLWKPKRVITSLAVGFAAVTIIMYIPQYVHGLVPALMVPTSSLRQVRAVWPVIVAFLAWVACVRARKSRSLYYLGALAGTSVLWSNDFGLPTMVSLLVFTAILAFARGQVTWKNAVFSLGSCVLTAAIVLTLSTGGHPLALLLYNYRDVAHDQWWYFTPWSESAKFFHLADLLKLYNPETHLPLTAIGVALAGFVFRPSIERGLLLWLSIAVFLGAATATVGGFFDNYFAVPRLWAGAALALVGSRAVYVGYLLIFRMWKNSMKPAGALLLIAVALGGSSTAAYFSFHRWLNYAQLTAVNPHKFYVKELGGYLPASWKEYVDQARSTPPAKEVEEYWGLWSAIRGNPSPWPVDSVIHALGKTRIVSENIVEKIPDIVVSSRTGTNGWHTWSITENWWFYRTLLRQFSPTVASPLTVLWKRRPGPPLVGTSVPCTYDPVTRSLQLNDQAGYYEIALTYRLAQHSARPLLFLRNNIVLEKGGSASLDPQGTFVRIPVYLPEDGLTKLHFAVWPRTDPFELTILACNAEKLPSLFGEELAL